MIGVRRGARVFARIVACIAACACSSTSISDNASIERYQYKASQLAPIAAQLSGTLSITSRNGDRFDGSLDVLRSTNNGLVERRAGSVHGRMTAGAMDFDVMLEGDVYRHVGRSDADTVAGSWIDASAVGNASSGTFRLARER